MTFASNHIAVVFPVYNAAAYLEEACRSLMRQRHPAFTVIAVNDGSKDDSGRILDAVAAKDPRFEVIHQENGGVSRARNAALDRIESLGIPWVAFFDSDDCVQESFLSDYAEALESNQADVAVCGWWPFDVRGAVQEPQAPLRSGRLEGCGAIARQFFSPIREQGLRQPQSSTFLNNRCFRAACLAGIRFDEHLRSGEDQEFFLRVLPRLQTGVLIPSVNHAYRLRAGSLSKASADRAYELQCYLQKLEKLDDYPLEAQVGIEKFTLDCWWQEVRRAYSPGGTRAERASLRLTFERLQRYTWHFPLSGKYESRFRRFRTGDWFLRLYFRLRLNRAVRRKANYYP